MKFCPCFRKISGLWNLFSLVPEGNCVRCYFRQLFMYLALRKCKNDCKILKITLHGTDFCPLRPELARFSIGFRLKSAFSLRWLATGNVFSNATSVKISSVSTEHYHERVIFCEQSSWSRSYIELMDSNSINFVYCVRGCMRICVHVCVGRGRRYTRDCAVCYILFHLFITI